jgi:ArsR family transcriptional regulator
MKTDYMKESEILKALAHPVRLRMAVGLVGSECNVTKMVKALGLPQSTVSQHLAVLKTRGIVEVHKAGVRTCCRVTDPRIKALLKIFES